MKINLGLRAFAPGLLPPDGALPGALADELGIAPLQQGPTPAGGADVQGARLRANHDVAAAMLLQQLQGDLPVQKPTEIKLSPGTPTAEELQAGVLNALVPMMAAHVHALLRELGFATGTDPTSLDDPKTQKALKQMQAGAGLPQTGNLDFETLLAMLDALMARDRQSSGGGRRSGGALKGRSSSGSAPSSGGSSGTASSTQSSQATKSSASTGTNQVSAVDTSNWKPGKGDVTPQEMQKIVPSLSAEKAREVAPHINVAMREAKIDTPQKKAAFIAQLAHESAGFKYSEEIASGAAYEGRADLGNTQPGDGTRFKGRGYIQLTGRANYDAAGKSLGLDLVNKPELAAKPENAARIAAWYWSSRGLNKYADGSQSGFDQITRRINGGFNGKADRDQYFHRALGVLQNNDGLPSTGELPKNGSGGSTVDIARQYLGRHVGDLKTDATDDLKMESWVPNNVNCANYVSAVLEENGKIDAGAKSASVNTLEANLKKRGWRTLPASQAQPGDVVIYRKNGGQHVELATGNGRAIGARNVNPDGSQSVVEGNILKSFPEVYVLRAP